MGVVDLNSGLYSYVASALPTETHLQDCNTASNNSGLLFIFLRDSPAMKFMLILNLLCNPCLPSTQVPHALPS